MIRYDTWFRSRHHFERERRERALLAQIRQVKQRWIPFSLLLQVEVQSHLTCFGVDAADHATFLVERVLVEQQARPPVLVPSVPPSSPSVLKHE